MKMWVGDRVICNDLGKEQLQRSIHKNSVGVIVGFSIDKKTARIMWESGNIKPMSINLKFLTKA